MQTKIKFKKFELYNDYYINLEKNYKEPYDDYLFNNDLQDSQENQNFFIEELINNNYLYAKDYFDLLLDFSKNNYYLVGNLQLWNGCRSAIKEIKNVNDLFNSSCENLIIEINSKKQIIFNYLHHDGTNTFFLKTLSQKGLKTIENVECYTHLEKKDFKFIKYNELL